MLPTLTTSDSIFTKIDALNGNPLDSIEWSVTAFREVIGTAYKFLEQQQCQLVTKVEWNNLESECTSIKVELAELKSSNKSLN